MKKAILPVEHFLYFWGIYPKLNNKGITARITYFAKES